VRYPVERETTSTKNLLRRKQQNQCFNTPNANMADRLVVARDELHESEAGEA